MRGAEQALATYIAAKHKAPKTGGQLDKTAVADVILLYLKEHAPKTKSLDFIRHTAKPIGEWWGDKTLSRSQCQDVRRIRRLARRAGRLRSDGQA